MAAMFAAAAPSPAPSASHAPTKTCWRRTPPNRRRGDLGGARLETRQGAGIRGAELAVKRGTGGEGGTRGGAGSPGLQRLQHAHHLRPQGGAPWRRPASGGMKDGYGANVVDDAHGCPSPVALPRNL
jgi:hypothetical protein